MVEFFNHKMEPLMSRVLEVRYTDLEQERALCQELLEWSQRESDAYGKAFALTYLGDYSLAVYDEAEAGRYLLQAKNLLVDCSDWDRLRLRLYSLLGIYYDIRTDEPNAIDCYLKAISVAENLQDVEGESVSLNNLAFIFQRHSCFKEAMDFYRKAYQLQASMQTCPFRAVLLGNLAEVALMLGLQEEAKGYIQECDQTEQDPVLREISSKKNWCLYYAAIGQKEQATAYATAFLTYKDSIEEDKLTAFESYLVLCKKMLELGEDALAGAFLHAMEAINLDGALERMKQLEETKIRYSLQFEPSNQHAEAYRRFYQKNQLYRKRVTQTIIEAMKSKIYLDQLVEQTQQMLAQQETLEQEVNLDELTGIYNRKFFEARMRTCINGAHAGQMGVIVLDVDYFKEYNDTYGHIKGDTVLREIAKCLMDHCPEGIYPCRYGGDEFVCICDNASVWSIEEYIKALRARLHQKAIPHTGSLCSQEVTLSIGYAMGAVGARVEVHLLFQLADQALYQSKRSGRNTYTRNRASVL